MTPRTMHRIVAESARAYGVQPEDVMGFDRRPRFVKPRQAAMVVMLECGASKYAVTQFFARDHTSIDNAEKRVAQRMTPDLRSILDTIKQRADVRQEA